MVDSTKETAQIDNESRQDQLRRVAAYAGVVAYLKVQEEEETGHISDKYKIEARETSGWGTASLMEGVGEKPMRSPNPSSKRNLWKTIVSSLLVSTFLFSQGSDCQARSFLDRFKLPRSHASGDTKGSAGVGFNGSNRPAAPAPVPGPVTSYMAEPFERSNFPIKPVQELKQPHAFMFDQNDETNRKTVYVRVGLLTGVKKVEFDTFDGAEIINLKDNSKVALVEPEGRFVISAIENKGESYLALSPRRTVDESFIVTGPQLNEVIEKVSFTPTALMTRPVVPPDNRSGAAFKDSDLAVRIPIENGGLPTNYLSGRSMPDLTTVSGILIQPKNYVQGRTSASFNLGGRSFRGALLLAPRAVKNSKGQSQLVLNAINVIDIEDYLLSVLPSEMPPSWPMEALKAQAIASRSYVMANLGKYQKDGFDVRATIMDQAYKGIVKETDRSNRAVLETAGCVMKHDGKIVSAFFHSSSGGHTEVSQHVWSKELPYLNAVKDFDHSSPHLGWQRSFAPRDLEKKLNLAQGKLHALFAIDRSPSKRVRNVLVVNAAGCDLVKGVNLRSALNLPSTSFNISYKDGAYIFSGQGFGHGLGMSQWGAKSLASHGYNAAQILKYYYKDVTFGQIFEEPAL